MPLIKVQVRMNQLLSAEENVLVRRCPVCSSLLQMLGFSGRPCHQLDRLFVFHLVTSSVFKKAESKRATGRRH